MKIRIKENSIRLRLTKSEVETFCSTGVYSQKTVFNAGVFNYALRAKENISSLEASFEDQTIIVFMPLKESKDWYDSPRVGFENKSILGSGEQMSILVEKDFACLDERDEDESDNYPNPSLSQ